MSQELELLRRKLLAAELEKAKLKCTHHSEVLVLQMKLDQLRKELSGVVTELGSVRGQLVRVQDGVAELGDHLAKRLEDYEERWKVALNTRRRSVGTTPLKVRLHQCSKQSAALVSASSCTSSTAGSGEETTCSAG